MEITQIKELLTDSFEKLRDQIVASKEINDTLRNMIKQHDINSHAVMDTTKRKDKTVKISDTETKTEYVARLPIPFQKKIVGMAASFLCGNPIELECNPKEVVETNLLEVLKKTWGDNKLDYKSKTLAKLMMSQTEVAELWYTEPANEDYWKGTANQGKTQKLRLKILSPSFGDKLYPIWSMSGDMVAFAREFSIKNEENKDVVCFDLYTEESIYHFQKDRDGWKPREVVGYDGNKRAIELNPSGKIPIIYYSQDQPEWADVQHEIDRYEKSKSNHADTNDYFGSPMIVNEGDVEGFAAKGESGKMLTVQKGGKVYTLSWDQSPESVKLEQENLVRDIHKFTSTPDISFESMKSIGAMSGIALKLLFLDAHLKASDKEETVGECVQRRINFLMNSLAKINVSLEKGLSMSVKPKFKYYLPSDEKETIQILTEATTGKILSQKTAVNLNPLVEDKEAEIIQLDKEANSAGAFDSIMNEG